MVTKLSQDILEDYLYKLNQFDVARERKAATPEHVLAILTARDEIHREITREDRTSLSFDPQRLIKLDDRLRKNAGKMTKVVREKQLGRWRSSMGAGESAWWWYLEDAIDHPLDRFDGLVRFFTIVFWTVNITLMVNLAAKFLGGGVGLLGVAAVATPSILGLLQIGSEFTKSGQEGFNRLLRVVHIPKQWREELKLLLALGLFGFLCFLWMQLPEFSSRVNNSGINSFKAGKIGEAEQSFSKAIALYSDNSDAHYQLGILYDQLEQFEKAKKEYLTAVAGDSLGAYSRLGRLYIKERKYAQAVALLTQGLDKINEKESISIDFGNLQQTVDSDTQYGLFKNLGWARLEQGRYEEAKSLLNIALSKTPKPEKNSNANDSINFGTAYCLLARVAERQKQDAQKFWSSCQQFGSASDTDQDSWLFQAEQTLKKTPK
jgi:tetratricopeptide (TPR) repeat protein